VSTMKGNHMMTSVVYSASAVVSQEYSQPAVERSSAPLLSRDIANSQDAGWMAKIRQETYKNPKVESLYTTLDDEARVDYWIVIPHRDIELVRELIKDQQKHVIDLFAGTDHPPFQLDFHIVYREGRDARDLVPDKAIEIPNF